MGGLDPEANRLDGLGVCARWFAGTIHLMAHRGGIDGDQAVRGRLRSPRLAGGRSGV